MQATTKLEALAAGLRHFVPAEPCKHGHEGARWAISANGSTRCLDCANEATTRYLARRATGVPAGTRAERQPKAPEPWPTLLPAKVGDSRTRRTTDPQREARVRDGGCRVFAGLTIGDMPPGLLEAAHIVDYGWCEDHVDNIVIMSAEAHDFFDYKRLHFRRDGSCYTTPGDEVAARWLAQRPLREPIPFTDRQWAYFALREQLPEHKKRMI